MGTLKANEKLMKPMMTTPESQAWNVQSPPTGGKEA
jgi:hypothetical protein